MSVIDSTSWHYRLYSWWCDDIAKHRPMPKGQTNLCHYMRVLLLYVPLFTIAMTIALIVLGLVLLVTAPIWVPCYFLFRNRAWVQRFKGWLERHEQKLVFGGVGAFVLTWFVILTIDEWWLGIVTFGVIAVTLAALIGGLFGIAELRDRRKRKQREQELGIDGAPRQPSLIWTWIKAKKRKICPIFEVR